MKAPNPRDLLHGGSSYVPLDVAKCPECGAPLYCMAMSWNMVTGKPFAYALRIDCHIMPPGHPRGKPAHQTTNVRDAVAKWAGAE